MPRRSVIAKTGAKAGKAKVTGAAPKPPPGHDLAKRIEKLEDLYLAQEIARDRAMTVLAERVHKLEQTHRARDDQELANYTRQVTDIDVKVNGMQNNIRAYDTRIVEVEKIVANSPTEAFTRLARRVHSLEAQTRYTGAYSEAVERHNNPAGYSATGSIRS